MAGQFCHCVQCGGKILVIDHDSKPRSNGTGTLVARAPRVKPAHYQVGEGAWVVSTNPSGASGDEL